MTAKLYTVKMTFAIRSWTEEHLPGIEFRGADLRRWGGDEGLAVEDTERQASPKHAAHAIDYLVKSVTEADHPYVEQ